MIVLLDAGPLGLVINSNKRNKQAEACGEWLKNLLENSISVCIPEISYYEVRRELKRADLKHSLHRLDNMKQIKGIRYLPITTEIILKASDLWAEARQKGRMTSSDPALDGDVILAATAISSPLIEKTVIATTNTKHLEWFTKAKPWEEITVESCLDADDPTKKPIAVLLETKIKY